jgi:hypothetical protein
MLWPGPSDASCVFWHDFEGLTATNLWADKSRNGLHATPQAGFVGPNYGLSRSSKGKGYATFTGAANSVANLPLRFYDFAPAGDKTIVAAVTPRFPDAGGHDIFGCSAFIAGSFYGFSLFEQRTGRSVCYHFIGDATLPNAECNPPPQLILDDNSHTICAAISTVPSWTIQGSTCTATWGAGSMASCVFSTVTVPTIGVGLNGTWSGDMSFLALFNYKFSDAEARAMSSWLRDQV